MTVYRGIGGKSGAMAPPDAAGVAGARLQDISDGLSVTRMFVEASDLLAVPWTQPDDGILPEEIDPNALFGLYPIGTNVGFCDGSVRFLFDEIDVQVLNWLIMTNDGESIPDDAFTDR